MATAAAEPWVPRDSFGIRLLSMRRQLGWTQRDAAERCGLDKGSWNNWENGSSPRNMGEVVRKIHDATGVNMGWLMWGTGSAGPVGPGEQGIPPIGWKADTDNVTYIAEWLEPAEHDEKVA